MSRQEDFIEAGIQYRLKHGGPMAISGGTLAEMAHEMNRALPFEAGAEYGYQYAVDKAFDILSQMLYTKRDDEHPAQHYTRSVESMGEFVSQTDFLNQFKQKMQ